MAATTQLVCSHLPPTPSRLAELTTALQRNLGNPQIDKIHLFLEDTTLETCEWPEAVQMRALWDAPKIKLLKPRRRQTYADFFEYANVNCPHQLVMISNSDIYYDATLSLLEKVDFSRHAVCLSRTELSPMGHTQPFLCADGTKLFAMTDEVKSFSQDTWVFRPPIKKMHAGFHLGVMRCDNRIAFEFNSIGLKPVNPCNSIRSYHLQRDSARTYIKTNVVPGPVLFIGPPYDLKE